MNVKHKLSGLRRKYWERTLPKIFIVTDLDPDGMRFEATTINERQRIVNRGDETAYIHEMIAYLDPTDVFYDIGANIGLVALHAARRCRTVAFEPDPAFRSRLQRNQELNPSVAMDVLPVAIADYDGTVTLFTDGADGNSPSLVRQRGEEQSVEVQAQTLDTLVAGGTLPRPTVLKMDIEGAEILALRGAKHLLHSPRPPRALFVEIHDAFLPAFGSSAEEVRSIAQRAGYGMVRYEAKRAGQQHLILEHDSPHSCVGW